MPRRLAFPFALLLALILAPLSTPLLAQGGFQGPPPAQGAAPGPQGGFTGPGLDVMTVAQALASRDDTNVVLRGTIVRSIGDERYTFKDTTGEVTIDVDNELWAGQLVSPQDTVEIHGEVDKEFMGGIEIDVSRITLVKQP